MGMASLLTAYTLTLEERALQRDGVEISTYHRRRTSFERIAILEHRMADIVERISSFRCEAGGLTRHLFECPLSESAIPRLIKCNPVFGR